MAKFRWEAIAKSERTSSWTGEVDAGYIWSAITEAIAKTGGTDHLFSFVLTRMPDPPLVVELTEPERDWVLDQLLGEHPAIGKLKNAKPRS